MKMFTVKIDVQVSDVRALLKAARERALSNDWSKEDWQFERRRGGLSTCVQMLYDPGSSFPGTSIYDCSVDDLGDI